MKKGKRQMGLTNREVTLPFHGTGGKCSIVSLNLRRKDQRGRKTPGGGKLVEGRWNRKRRQDFLIFFLVGLGVSQSERGGKEVGRIQ